MHNIGIFSVKEQFTQDLIKSINHQKRKDIHVEFAMVGETRYSQRSPYRVIIDRISSHVPYFRSCFKNSSLQGSYIINNPFGHLALDRFYSYNKTRKLGISIPRTVTLPTREYHPACGSRDLTNLKYPLDWEGIADFIGFPAILKPYESHGYRDVFNINSIKELIECYNGTGNQVMVMQEFIQADYHVRTFVIGGEHAYTIIEDPFQGTYSEDPALLGEIDLEKIINGARNICRELNTDFNSVEFSIQDGIPYAINFLTTHPDCRRENLTADCYQWILDKLTGRIIEIIDKDLKNHRNILIQE